MRKNIVENVKTLITYQKRLGNGERRLVISDDVSLLQCGAYDKRYPLTTTVEIDLKECKQLIKFKKGSVS